jgi:hypothetical protein
MGILRRLHPHGGHPYLRSHCIHCDNTVNFDHMSQGARSSGSWQTVRGTQDTNLVLRLTKPVPGECHALSFQSSPYDTIPPLTMGKHHYWTFVFTIPLLNLTVTTCIDWTLGFRLHARFPQCGHTLPLNLQTDSPYLRLLSLHLFFIFNMWIRLWASTTVRRKSVTRHKSRGLNEVWVSVPCTYKRCLPHVRTKGDLRSDIGHTGSPSRL